MILLSLLIQAAPATCPRPPELPAAAASSRCEGLADARAGRWPAAAAAFEAGARAAGPGADTALWAQAGNAWLAAGDPARAATALDAALVRVDTLSSFERGELLLDRARASVGIGDPDGARTRLDQALLAVPDDPLAWLLSATLARRAGDVRRAQKDIGEALRRAPDDASVRLEAGNVAALAHDEAGARAAWAEAVRIAPDSPAGRHAAMALQQFTPAAEPKRAPAVVEGKGAAK